jgi:hypothetical protein
MGGQIAISLRHEIKLCFRYRQPGFHVFSMTRRWRVDVLTVYVLSIHRTSISRLSSLLKGGVDASTCLRGDFGTSPPRLHTPWLHPTLGQSSLEH